MLWAALAFILVIGTKYLTSVRLRHLRERIDRDRKDVDELQRLLSEVSEKETVLKTEIQQLMLKATTLHTIITNLEHSLYKAQSTPQTAAGE
jgi:chromosome segregation ATPase